MYFVNSNLSLVKNVKKKTTCIVEETNYSGTYRSKYNMQTYSTFNQHYRERKLNDQRVKDKETDLRRREQEVKRMEGEYEQKLKNEMTK